MFRFMTAGESHGQGLVAIIEGMPAGMPVSLEAMQQDLARRQQGYGRGGRMKIEKDQAEVISGMRFGETLGSPLTLLIKNKDWENWQARMAPNGLPNGEAVTAARPGHADLTGSLKYDRSDVRDILERASARETAARVAVGAIARQLLAACGIKIASHVTEIGGVRIKKDVGSLQDLQDLYVRSELACVEAETEELMKAAIRRAKEAGDTLGGCFEVLADGLPPGLGSHVQWDRRLDGRIAAALMSIPAIKGVEVGAGFAYGALSGKNAHDEIFYDEQKGYYRRTNRAGGIEGGMSNGELIVIRAAMKPIPTLMSPLQTVDISNHQAVSASTERSDVCAVTAAAVVGEAMLAIVLAEALLEMFGGSCLGDLQANLEHYRQRVAKG